MSLLEYKVIATVKYVGPSDWYDVRWKATVPGTTDKPATAIVERGASLSNAVLRRSMGSLVSDYHVTDKESMAEAICCAMAKADSRLGTKRKVTSLEFLNGPGELHYAVVTYEII